MRGILLAAGAGTRLLPLTNVTNKCLLPVYDKPMIYWPIATLAQSGIDDILIVCGHDGGSFLQVLQNGEEFGLTHLNYAYQSEAKGIADALLTAKTWAQDDDICVVLADNLFENTISKQIESFQSSNHQACVFVTETEHPQFYGVVEIHNGTIKSIEEKPKFPKSNYIATGLYMYDKSVWDKIESLSPSYRNELEITDLNNLYLKEHQLMVQKLSGEWYDAGESIDVYVDTCIKVRNWKKK